MELLKTLGCQLKQQHLSNLFNFIHNHDKTPHFAYLLESNGLKENGIWKMVTEKKPSISNCIKEDKNWTDNWDKILQQFKKGKHRRGAKEIIVETQNCLKFYSSIFLRILVIAFNFSSLFVISRQLLLQNIIKVLNRNSIGKIKETNFNCKLMSWCIEELMQNRETYWSVLMYWLVDLPSD